MSRHDLLVQQILEERRRQRQETLCQDSAAVLLTRQGDPPVEVAAPAGPTSSRPALDDLSPAPAGRTPPGPAQQYLEEALALRAAPAEPELRLPIRRPRSAPRAGAAAVRWRQAAQPLALPVEGCGRPSSAPPMRGRGREEGRLQPPDGSPGTFASRVEEWSLRYQALKRRRQLAREEQETREVEGCTFRPSINTRSQLYASRLRACYTESLGQRLHHEADRRATLRNKAKELLEADELYGCSFRPQINASAGQDADRTPIHLRAEEIQQQRKERLREAQMAEDLRADCPFQPRISGRSEKIVQRKRDRLYRSVSQGDRSCIRFLGPVEDRLYADAQAAEERRRSGSAGEASQSSLGAPTVDEESRRICRSSVYFQGAQRDFLTRQHTFELARQRRMEVRSHHAEAECPFRPRISETSRRLVSGNHELVGETLEERIHRLAVKDVERRDQLKGELEQLVYRECTFRPEVSAASHAIASKVESASQLDVTPPSGGDSSIAAAARVHERLYRSSLARSKSSPDSREEECSFHPKLDPRSVRRFAHVKARYTSDGSAVMETIRKEMERKEEVAAARRKALEERQRAECTFAPGVRKPYQEPQRPVIVSGLARFFELRERASRQQREQQEREAKVFRPEAARPRPAGVTIPEPFGLSVGPGEESVKARRLRELGSGVNECTFTPQTNESANRERIRQLVNSSLNRSLARAGDSAGFSSQGGSPQ